MEVKSIIELLHLTSGGRDESTLRKIANQRNF